MRALLDRRGQASLPALAIALLVLSSVTVLALAVADGALAAADRDPGERHVAESIADRLTAAGGPVAVRENVLDEETLADLDGSRLRDRIPVVGDAAVRITVGDRRVVADPNARGGTAVRRLVAVRAVETRTITPAFGTSRAVTLPRRAGELDLEIDPPENTTIRSVRANDRVLLANDRGLDGEFSVDLSRFETVRLEFRGSGPLYAGNVTIDYPVEETHRTTLTVTVDE